MSSILEKLMILIQMDASGLKQGAEQVQTSTDKIDHALDKTSHHASAMGHVFGHLKRELTGFVFSMIGIGAAIEGVKASFDYFSKVSDASDKLQVNVSLLDAWNEAVVKAGGTAESFDESIKRVAEHFNTSNATVLKVLPQFADLFHRFNSTQAQAYGKKLGFDEPTIQLLHQGGKAVEEIIEKQKRLGVITQQQKDIMDKYNAAWGETRHAFRYLSMESEFTILPALTSVVRALGKFFQAIEDHSDFAKGAILGIAAAMIYLGRNSLVAWLEFLGPIALVIAGIAAFGIAVGLVYEDVRAFMRGQESFIGNLIKEYPRLGKVILSVINGIKLGIHGLNWLWKKEFELLQKSIEEIEKAYSKIKGFFDKHFHHGDHPISVLYKSTIPTVNMARAAIAEASSSPINTMTSNSILYGRGLGALKQPITKDSSVHIGNLTINTNATDGAGIAFDFQKALSNHFFQAQSQLDNGQES